MSTLTRSVSPFLQTGRSVLLRSNGANPFVSALGRGRSAARTAQACRGLATAFERTKPHVNIGTMHGCWLGVPADVDRHHWPRRPWKGSFAASIAVAHADF